MAENITATYSRFGELVHAGFMIVVIIAALFGNGFVCMAVYRVRRLQKVSNYFLVSLAVSDILVVLFSIPFRVYVDMNTVWSLGEHACKFWIFIDVLCSTASIVNLSLISIDRYVALSQSLRYLAVVTATRCRVGIAVVWSYSFAISIFSLHTWTPDGGLVSSPYCQKSDKMYYTISTILGIMLPFVVLLVLYCLVFKIALEQRQKIMKNNYTTTTTSSRDGTVMRPRDSPRRFAIRELKATKTLIIVVGAFLVCWVPLFVMVIMQQYAPDYVDSLPPKRQEVLGLILVYTLPLFNSCLNPYIYTFHNAEFRAVFKATFGRLLPFLKIQSKSEKQTRHSAPLSADSDFVSTDF